VSASAAGELGGVWNIVPTPFAPDGALDLPSLRRLTDFVAGTGVDGMTILGFMGEAHKLSDAERTVVIETTLDRAAGRLPVCVGVSHAETARAVAFAREASARGAHSLMLAPAAMTDPSDDMVVARYAAVAGATELPIVVQDYPPGSGVVMSVAVIAAIAGALSSCRHLKLEDEPTPPKVRAILAAEPRIRILGGLGASALYEELEAGVVGTMTGFGFPEILVDIVGRYRRGDRTGARTAFERALPLIRFENQPGVNLPLRKHLYRRRGAIAHERVRPPAPTLTVETMAGLDAILHDLGLADGLGPIVEPTT
jgi:4-hydroxy-tetrahydrodipicolinate synthase